MILSKKTILVTGGAGFIGSNLVDRLLKDNYKVVVVDNLETGKFENINPKVKFYNLDICSLKISKIFKKEKPEVVFHFAALVDVGESIKNPLQEVKTNIFGSVNILENCINFNVKKVIFASSAAVYDKTNVLPTSEDNKLNPRSPYGISKLTIEKYLNYYYTIFGLSFVVLRFANVYGKRQNSNGKAGVIAIFCDKILNKKSLIIYGSGKQTRDFIYVEDVVESAILSMKENINGFFNVGTGKETSINNVLKVIGLESGLKFKKKYILSKEDEQQRSCLDCKKAKRVLKWQAKFNFSEGIRLTLNWIKNK